MIGRRAIAVFIATVLVLAAAPQALPVAGQGGGACEALVTRALSEIGINCAGLGPSRVCYGFAPASATLVEGTATPEGFFATPGYQTDLGTIAALKTGSFASAASQWGIAMLNVPLGGAPAESTVYLMLGDVELINAVTPPDPRGPQKSALAPMQAFELKTGLDSTECLSVPPSSLVVQSPAGRTVVILVNDVEIALSSTVILRAPRTGQLQVITGNGQAVLFPGEPNQIVVPPGVSVNVAIGPNTLEWREWRVMSQGEWDSYGELENVPQNVFRERYGNPQVVRGSGAGEPPTQIQLPTGVILPIPPRGRPPFPLIAMFTGVLGEELPGAAWEPLSIGDAVCPDWVLYHTNRDNNWEIYSLGMTNALTNNITRAAASADIQPTYAQDGEWMAFTTDRDMLGGWEIYLSQIDGSNVRRLTSNTAFDINPVWGPAGMIVFESNRDGNWELYMVDVTGDGVPVRLTNDPAQDVGAFWYPDGEHIAFESDRDGDWEVFVLNVLTGELTQITNNEVVDRQPVVSHDGKTLAWLQTDARGIENLWLMDLESGEARQATDSGFSISGPIFAPDDTFVAYYAPDAQGDAEVYALEIATGRIKALTNNTVEDRAPTFWCETPQVIFQSEVLDQPNVAGQYELFMTNPLPLDGPAGTPARLTDDPDGDDIFAVNDPRSESNTRPNLILGMPLQ